MKLMILMIFCLCAGLNASAETCKRDLSRFDSVEREFNDRMVQLEGKQEFPGSRCTDLTVETDDFCLDDGTYYSTTYTVSASLVDETGKRVGMYARHTLRPRKFNDDSSFSIKSNSVRIEMRQSSGGGLGNYHNHVTVFTQNGKVTGLELKEKFGVFFPRTQSLATCKI